MKYRPGTPDDTEAAVAVWKSASAARMGIPLAAPGGEKRLRSYISKPDSFLIVADDSGEVVGMALGLQGLDVEGDGSAIPGLCHIGAVFVSPERWGEGIGGDLVDRILSEARSQGYVHAQLWTNHDNTRAQRLYEVRDFLLSGKTGVDDLGEEIVQYERRL